MALQPDTPDKENEKAWQTWGYTGHKNESAAIVVSSYWQNSFIEHHWQERVDTGVKHSIYAASQRKRGQREERG